MWLKQAQIEECARVAHEKCFSCFQKHHDEEEEEERDDENDERRERG